MSVLEGYAFCITCKPWAIAQHSRFTTDAQKQKWTERLAGQLANWRSVSVTATAAMGAVGMAIGGAGALIVGGTSALVRGALEGVRATSQSGTAVPIEDEEVDQQLREPGLEPAAGAEQFTKVAPSFTVSNCSTSFRLRASWDIER